MSIKKVVLGVAPARRGWFTNEVVVENRNKIMAMCKTLCEQSGAEIVDICGLSDDNMLADNDTADKVIEKFTAAGVNALFFPHCNFGQEEAIYRVSKALNVPVLLWGERDGSPNGADARDTDTQCGLFASGKALYRAGIPFTYIENCYINQPAFATGFINFITAARIITTLKGARIAQISVRPQPFLSVIINESELFERFGFELVPVPATKIIQDALNYSTTDAASEIINEYHRAGIYTENMSDEAVSRMAGLELSIRAFAQENHCSAVVSECWNIFGDSLGIKPCATFGNLIDSGLPIACENDVHGAISMLIAQACNNFSEPVFLADLTQRHPTNDNAELLWHCGPFPKALKKANERATIKNGMGQWQLKDGDLTLIRFDGCRNAYSLFAGGAVSADGPLTNGNYIWAQVDNWVRWEEKLVCGPYIHHIACVYGTYTNAIREACKYIPTLSFDEP